MVICKICKMTVPLANSVDRHRHKNYHGSSYKIVVTMVIFPESLIGCSRPILLEALHRGLKMAIFHGGSHTTIVKSSFSQQLEPL